MAWGFLDWVRGRPPRHDPSALTLAEGASPEEVRDIALLLPSDPRGFEAYQLLDANKERARPVLERLFKEDARFRTMEGEVNGWSRPPLDVVLTILVQWHSPFALQEVSGFVGAKDWCLRAIAARLLASTGDPQFIPMLVRLAADEHNDVREAVASGISDVCDGLYGYTLEDSGALALYELLRDCALRIDSGPGTDFAAALLRADRDRAIEDFTNPAALSIDRLWLGGNISALRDAGVELTSVVVSRLLSEAIAIYDKEDFDADHYSLLQYLTTDLIVRLADADLTGATTLIRKLRRHPQADARDAAQSARQKLMSDPLDVVYNACKTSGHPLKMRPEHRVVYFVSVVDGEVCNGGWLQWIANPSGEFAVETLVSLRAIGADVAADQLQKVIETIGPEGSSSDQKKRMKAIDRMMSAGKSLPEDRIIWDMSTELQALYFDYAEEHPDAFPGTGTRSKIER